jgi:shikimate dehydrogenase
MFATTKLYGCVADPIDHVKAPTIFTSIFKSKNIDAVMIPLHVSSTNLVNLVKTLKLINNFHGFTVTIPHKSTVVKLCDFLDPEANSTQAVNWIKFGKNRELIGNNFDGKGFVKGFLSQGYIFACKIVCLFGAGGAAVAIACSLANEGIKELKLVNRDINKAYELKKRINSINKDIKITIFFTYDYNITDCDIIINATSLGLKQNDKIPFDVTQSPSNCIIADIIMQPEETELLKQAKLIGRSVHYGKNMIESQIDLVGDFLNLW